MDGGLPPRPPNPYPYLRIFCCKYDPFLRVEKKKHWKHENMHYVFYSVYFIIILCSTYSVMIVHVCMRCVCVRFCIYARTCLYVCPCLCVCVYVCLYAIVCAYICVCVCFGLWLFAFVYFFSVCFFQMFVLYVYGWVDNRHPNRNIQNKQTKKTKTSQNIEKFQWCAFVSMFQYVCVFVSVCVFVAVSVCFWLGW